MKFCSKCGKEIVEGVAFCQYCGCSVNETNAALERDGEARKVFNASKKIKSSYFVSIISAIVSLIIRISSQDTYYSWSNLLNNRKVVGLDEDIKPFLTAIPVCATIIISLLIVSDKQTVAQKKMTAFIVNAIFILLSILFIWFDVPYAIIDF